MKLNIFKKKGEKVMERSKNPYFNSEGYPDPNAYHGMKNVVKEEENLEKQVSDLIHVFKVICSLAGFEIIGRVHFRHKESEKDFK